MGKNAKLRSDGTDRPREDEGQNPKLDSDTYRPHARGGWAAGRFKSTVLVGEGRPFANIRSTENGSCKGRELRLLAGGALFWGVMSSHARGMG